MKHQALIPVLSILIVTVFVSGTTNAQDSKQKRPEQKANMEKLSNALNLTEEQESQVKQILEEAREAQQKARVAGVTDASVSREAGRERMKATHSKIRAILTDEQKTKFDTIVKRRARQRREAPNSDTKEANSPGTAPPDKP